MRRFLFLMITFPLLLNGQAGKRPRTAIIGVVLDAETNTPLEYATVIAYRVKDSVKVGGTATNERGRFVLKNLKFGKYFLNVDFIGYTRKSIKVVLSPEKPFVRLGKIYLKPAVIESKPVEVRAKAPALTFKIDKKVINVTHELTTGTAVDALKNAPSVEVDIEGNVKIRGSSNFTLLIDGRPTLADPNEVLQQLPAAMIDKIEIITNPSAKYDPEGEAGIINIVLKKNRKKNTGFTLSGSLGSFNNYGLNALLTLRKRRFDFYASFSFGHRTYPGDYETEKAVYLTRDTLWIRSIGTTQFEMMPFYFRTGINLKLSPKDILTLGGSFSKWQMKRGINAIFENENRTHEEFRRKHPHYGAFFSFEHDFGSRSHRLNFDLSFSRGHSSGKSYYAEWDSSGAMLEGREVPSTGRGWRIDSRINYKKLIGSGKFEAGYQGHYRQDSTYSESFIYNPDSGRFIYHEEYSQAYRDIDRRHAVYALFSSTHGRMGYKAGLRGEYSHKSVKDIFSGQADDFKDFNYFPSLHVSFDIGAARELMLSYSRRIRRPRGWMMRHFKTWIDPHTIMMGNPALKPEYIDSYELGVKFPVPDGLLSANIYHKTIHNRIERVSQPDTQNIFIETFKNTGNAYRTGVEFLLNWSPLSLVDLNWSFDMFRYQATGLDGGRNESLSWSTRLTGDIKLGSRTGLEILYRYRSPVSTSQGKREGFYVVDLGLKEKITKNISLTIQIKNLTGSFRWESESEGENYYSRRSYTRSSRMVSLSIRYNFNTYRHRKQHQGEENIEWEEFF